MKLPLQAYLDELLLYSGQYALFYTLMNLSKTGLGFFSYPAHVLMLLGLLIQILFLVHFGSRPMQRFLGSLICPTLYTLIEINDLQSFVLNSGHFFFWVFSIGIGLANAANLKNKGRQKDWLEFGIVFMNVIMFLFVYMYFDMMLKLEEMALAAGGQFNEYSHQIAIVNLGQNLPGFLSDPAHIYLIAGGLLLGISLGIGKVRLNRLKETIIELFGTYTDPSIRDRILSTSGVLDEKRSVAVLFCDIRNFTTLSERWGPTETIGTLNRYFALWEQTASQHGGVINKYIGDAVMILFGLNDDTANASSQAVACAISFNSSFAGLNDQLTEMNFPSLDGIGVGIHYGEVFLGNVGSDRRREFTAIGDTVNVAARLEQQTKELYAEEDSLMSLLISEAVYNQLPPLQQHRFSRYADLLLKGKQTITALYRYLD